MYKERPRRRRLPPPPRVRARPPLSGPPPRRRIKVGRRGRRARRAPSSCSRDVAPPTCADVGAAGGPPVKPTSGPRAARPRARWTSTPRPSTRSRSLCATDDGVLYRRARRRLARRAGRRKEDEGEPPRAFPLVLGLWRRATLVAHAAALGGGRPRDDLACAPPRCRMLGVVERYGSAPRKETPPVLLPRNMLPTLLAQTRHEGRLPDPSKRDRRFCCERIPRPCPSPSRHVTASREPDLPLAFAFVVGHGPARRRPWPLNHHTRTRSPAGGVLLFAVEAARVPGDRRHFAYRA